MKTKILIIAILLGITGISCMQEELKKEEENILKDPKQLEKEYKGEWDLKNRILKDYHINDITVRNSNWSNLTLYRSGFAKCKFENVKLTGISIETFSNMTECEFTDVVFNECIIQDTCNENEKNKFKRCKFLKCTFVDNARGGIEQSEFEDCTWQDSTIGMRFSFNGSKFIKCKFKNSSIEFLCQFNKTVMNDVTFEKCTIRDTTFDEIEANNLQIKGGKLIETGFGDRINNMVIEDCELHGVSFSGDNISVIKCKVVGSLGFGSCNKMKNITIRDVSFRGSLAFGESEITDLIIKNVKVIEELDLFELKLTNCLMENVEISSPYQGAYLKNVHLNNLKCKNVTFDSNFKMGVYKNVTYENGTDRFPEK